MRSQKGISNRGLKIRFAVFALVFSMVSFGSDQQTASKVEPPRTADESFHPEIKAPAFPKGKGPVVLIDEAHNNFHTATGTYKPFAALLKRD